MKRLLAALLAIAASASAATRDIQPNGNGEGNIGSPSNRWNSGYYDTLTASNWSGLPAQPIRSLNGSTNPVQVIAAGAGMVVSNQTVGTTTTTYVAFGNAVPISPTNLAGWSRYAYDQVAAGVAGATSQVLSVTSSNGITVYFKMWGAAGGSGNNSYYISGGAGAFISGTFVAASGAVITVRTGQGGPRYSTNGVIAAWPDGGISTNKSLTNGCGGASSSLLLNGNIIAVAGGGGGASLATPSNTGGGQGGISSGTTGGGPSAGTGGTQLAGGILNGGYLLGGTGPGCGGGGGYYGGGAGQADGSTGGGGSSWYDPNTVVITYTAATSGYPYSTAPNTTDVDYTLPIAAGGGAAGGSGRIVLYVRPL